MGGADHRGDAAHRADALTPTERPARERILDAAQTLFADPGFDATPVARLAAAAGVPKGLVFHYFPSKLALLVALVEERGRLDEFAADPVPAVPGDAAATLERVAGRFRAAHPTAAAVRHIAFRESRAHPAVRGCLTRLTLAAERHVRAALDAALGVADRSARPARDAAAAAFAAALLHDLTLQELVGRSLDLSGIARVVAAGLQSASGVAGLPSAPGATGQ